MPVALSLTLFVLLLRYRLDNDADAAAVAAASNAAEAYAASQQTTTTASDPSAVAASFFAAELVDSACSESGMLSPSSVIALQPNPEFVATQRAAQRQAEEVSRETYTTSQKNETIGAIAEKLDLPAGDLVKINKPFYGRITAKTKFKTQTVLYLSARAAEAGTAPPPSGRELAAKAAAASTVPNSFPNGDDYIATLVSPDHSAEFALFVMLGDMCSSCEDGNTSPRVTGDLSLIHI